MNRHVSPLVVGAFATLSLQSQEMIWETTSQRDGVTAASFFGDLDRDGSDDVLCYYVTGASPPSRVSVRVLSGATGLDLRLSTASSSPPPVGRRSLREHKML